MLPLGISQVNTNFAGSVVNMVFSPNTGGVPGDDIWLAVATETAGI